MAKPVAGIRIGIDIGGTFTDLQILNEATGALGSLKTPTTPEDPSLGLMTGIAAAAERFGFALGDIRYLLHGTTIATNAVLERKLPRGVLIATAGFEDVLEIGRHARRDVYGLRPRREPALIPRDRRLGLMERVRGDGSVETALAAGEIDRVIDRATAVGAETVAVALLNGFANPAHEQRVAERLAERCPGLPVSLATEVSPEIREYERSSTTVLNALLMPVVRTYLRRLARRLAEADMTARLLLVQSNGGVCSAEMASRQPVRLLLSGPSGGALAALRAAEALALPNLVGIDMGGTSFDVCVVRDGRVDQVTQGEIDGLPVRLSMVEIRTIGAGGGSIAAVDAGGRLTVGPRSAGARPGPACYGHGGSEPTVTDANLVLGRLDPEFFLGGGMALDRDAAASAVASAVARPLGLALEAAAEGLLTVTDASLAAAIRLSLFEKGLDPRDFSLLSFGGAGGLHAIAVAAELGIGRVVFPADASTFSAQGILDSDIVHDVARSRLLPAAPESLDELAALAQGLRSQGEALLAEDGLPPERQDFALSVDMRYHGQAFELVVPWPEAPPWPKASLGPASLAALVERFHALHRQRFSYANPEDRVEIVTLRLAATGRMPRRGAPPAPSLKPAGTAGRRPVFIAGAWHDAAIHRRAALAREIAGPALIEEDYTTVLIPEGWRCGPGPQGTLIARMIPAAGTGERP